MAGTETEASHHRQQANTDDERDANGVVDRSLPSSSAPLQSDLTLNAAKFRPSAITPETRAFNRHLQEIEAGTRKWYEVGTIIDHVDRGDCKIVVLCDVC